MASSPDFVQYIAEQAASAGEIRCKKMFGDYGVYCDGLFFGLICDNRFFVKPTEAGLRLQPDARLVPPYEGAKPCLLMTEVDDRDAMAALVSATCRELPAPKAKKR